MRLVPFFILIIILIAACMPYEPDEITEIKIDYSNKEIQKIIDFQDKRNIDSLIPFIKDKNPAFRFLVAKTFASFKEKQKADALYPLLKDPVDEVRAMAAFALGQTKDSLHTDVLIQAFDNMDTMRVHEKSNAQILEAVGKCGNLQHLKLIASVEKYELQDSILIKGQSRSIYQFGLRGVHSTISTKLMMDYIMNQQYPSEIRLMAAHHLHRTKGIVIDSSIQKICTHIKNETNPNIRMATVTGIAKSKLSFARDTLLSMLKTDSDYRVKCNIIRALSFFEYPFVAPTIIQQLKSENVHVALTAADYLYINGTEEDAKAYRIFAKESQFPRVKYRLYAAALKNLPYFFSQSKASMTADLLAFYNESENLHDKIMILEALAEFEWNYTHLNTLGFEKSNPALKSTATAGLIKILESPNFNNVFQLGARKKAFELKTLITQAIRSKDAGTVAIAASALNNEKNDFKAFYESQGGFLFLDTVLMNIPLPEEIETYKEVQKVINTIKGIENPKEYQAEYSHPIEWDLVKSVTDRVRGVIQTNKGKIVIEFYPKSAPLSVANFIDLCKNKYYDNKLIHRVVPNFVAQFGCKRGDGYGSEDYAIRTEIGKISYNDEGYVGMASAGKDTEGVQWFITHSPTPHLDGNYTIFGKVKEGMDIVHQLEKGDVIEKARIVY